MRNTIILPWLGFKTFVLMITAFGEIKYNNGGFVMCIKKKFLIGMIIYTLLSWCLGLYFLWVIYNNALP